MDTLAAANRAISAALDEADPVPGSYALEVSSPGVERSLRRPEHFNRYVGETVKVKTRPGITGDRRLRGRLVAADETGIEVLAEGSGSRHLAYADIESARTVFEWGPSTKREGPTGSGARRGRLASKGAS